MSDQILEQLNESQKIAVTAADGPLLIVAGPGTGKTLTIVRRIAYLIGKGVDPENIIALTFTNRAAKEMRERTAALLGDNSLNIFIGTFHLLGLKILMDNLLDNFQIYNRDDQRSVLKELMQAPDLKKSFDGVKPSYMNILNRISRIKNFMEEPEDEVLTLYKKYQSELKKNAAFDFDDLIIEPLNLLENAVLLEKYRGMFRYIIVDEYQDINTAQYRLLKLLSGRRGNICTVGDSDQAIYAFRGADVENFLNFSKDFENTMTIHLTDNYRSTAVIVNASGKMIAHNRKRIDKVLSPVREKGRNISVISTPDDKGEGNIIVKEIETRVGGTSHYQMIHTDQEKDYSDDAYSFSDFAVIYRTNAQAKALEETLSKSGIPYQVIGRTTMQNAGAAADTITYLKVIVDPEDDIHFRKLISSPSVGIEDDISTALSYAREFNLPLFDVIRTMADEGDNTKKEYINRIEKLSELKESLPFNELLEAVWEDSGIRDYYKDSENNFDFLRIMAAANRNNLKPDDAVLTYINELSLITPADAYDPRADAVTLMTMHMAKGLEFRVVFITGVEDGLIPYTLRKDNSDIEEERRLFYVGMTRAKDDLYLIHSRNRFIYGQRLTPAPSPFLADIPDKFIQSNIIADRAKRKKEEDRQMGLF